MSKNLTESQIPTTMTRMLTPEEASYRAQKGN